MIENYSKFFQEGKPPSSYLKNSRCFSFYNLPWESLFFFVCTPLINLKVKMAFRMSLINQVVRVCQALMKASMSTCIHDTGMPCMLPLLRGCATREHNWAWDAWLQGICTRCTMCG